MSVIHTSHAVGCFITVSVLPTVQLHFLPNGCRKAPTRLREKKGLVLCIRRRPHGGASTCRMWTLQRGALLRFFAIGNLQISQHSPRLTPEYVLQRSLLERTPWLGAGEDAAQICSLTRGVCRDVCERSIHSFPPRNASSGKTYLASFKYEFVCFLPDCISTAGVGSPLRLT